MSSLPLDIATKMLTFIESSKDGYALFDRDDRLIYANYPYRDIFCLSQLVNETCTFNEMVYRAFAEKRGINIEAEHIDEWLAYVATVRRGRLFRVFEVDLVDGRWFLFSEQLSSNGELMVQTKDITRQKVLESELTQSMNSLSKLALTDELTQLANRRSFVDSVESELARCKRVSGFITMMVVDLDFFKTINDTHGHQGGDAVLVEVAKILKSAIRQYDIVGRIGGEEFAIFLGSCELDIALEISERIRFSLEHANIPFAGKSLSITASIGLTSKACNASFEELYTEADQALYLAKEKGRNRVELFTHS